MSRTAREQSARSDETEAATPKATSAHGRKPVGERTVAAIASMRQARSDAAPKSRDGAGAPASTVAAPKAGRPALPRKAVVGAAAAIALLIAGGYGIHYWLVGRYMVSTDDAYVGANITQLSARIAARVEAVPVEANQRVKKGDPLVMLDDGDFKLAVDQSKSRLATQQATIARIGRQIEAARASAEQAKAQVPSAAAEVARSESEFGRTSTLAGQRISSAAALDTARANRDKAQAALAAAKAGLSQAEANVSVLEAQQTEAERAARELEVAVAKAERDLDATVVRAPLDGVIGNKSVQVGDYVTPGKRLAAVVPLDEVYIDANFKETQLPGIVPGAKVRVTIDAAKGEGFDGTVESLAPASGSQFSLLPPDNATGNFTKIVQRIPVRIAVPRAAVETGALRPGLSVVATVDTRARSNTGKAAPKASQQGEQPPHTAVAP